MKLYYVVLNSICLLLLLIFASLVIMWEYLYGMKVIAYRNNVLRKGIVSDTIMLSDFIFKSKIHLLYVKERIENFSERNEENLMNIQKSVTILESNVEGVIEKNKTSCYKLFDNQTCGEWMVERLKLCAYLRPSFHKITSPYVQQTNTIIDSIVPWSQEILVEFGNFQNYFNNAIKAYKAKKLKCDTVFLRNACTHRNNKWAYGQFKNITFQHMNLSAAISSIKNVSIIFTKLFEMFETSMWHAFDQSTNNYLICLNKLNLT